MARFEHEAVAIGCDGTAYLTEDAGSPHGCFYRFEPHQPLRGRGSLHAGGTLAAMAMTGVNTDLSIIQEPGTVLPVTWVPVPNPDPGENDAKVRASHHRGSDTDSEGVWTGFDGSIWFVSCRGDGPDAEDEEDVSAAVHSGQIWRYYPRGNRIELVTLFPKATPSMDRKPYHRSGSGRHSMISTDSPGNIAKCG